MCGIAGLIHRGASGEIGREMTAMLQALRHRGPDSAGFAVYGVPEEDRLVLRFKVAEQEDMASGFAIHRQIEERKAEVDRRLGASGAEIVHQEAATEYAFRYLLAYDGDLRRLADYLEDVEGAEILSMGRPDCSYGRSLLDWPQPDIDTVVVYDAKVKLRFVIALLGERCPDFQGRRIVLTLIGRQSILKRPSICRNRERHDGQRQKPGP